MVFLALELRPVLELEDPELREGDEVLELVDETGSDVVKVCATTLPLIVVVRVVRCSTSD